MLVHPASQLLQLDLHTATVARNAAFSASNTAIRSAAPTPPVYPTTRGTWWTLTHRAHDT